MSKWYFVMLLSSFMYAQEQSKSSSELSSQEKSAMVELIAEGRSLLQAGKTGDKDLSPPLQSFIKSRSADPSGIQEARMALAKLGDDRAQQEIVCDFYGNVKSVMQQPTPRWLGIDGIAKSGAESASTTVRRRSCRSEEGA